jgi:hypothetical protein
MKVLLLLKKYYQPILVGLLILLSAVFRFWDLGYSDYIPDEYKSFMVLREGESPSDFFLRQRKGPMQFLLNSFTFQFSQDYRNELLHRIPFTLISCINVFLFFLLAKKLTNKFENSFEISIISAFLFSFNGFIFGFSRIAQYQNLNMFFSFISVLLFFKLMEQKGKYKQILFAFLSSIFFIFSILSHWDAVFYLILILCLLVTKYLEVKDTKFLIRTVVTFFVTNLIILGTLLYFYLSKLSQNSSNQDYLERRIEFLSSNLVTFYNYIVLYNPYLFFSLAVVSIIYSFYFFKKNIQINIWFLLTLIIFILFFKKPGTHIYNFLLPVFLMIGIFLTQIWELKHKKIPTKFQVLKYPIISVVLFFLFFQTYTLFVDSKNEYPFEVDKIFFLKTHEYRYSEEEKLPLFGFPNRRNWNGINSYLLAENKKRGKDLKYISNEDDGIVKWYLDLKYGQGEEFYYIGVRNPQNFISDYRPRGFKIVETVLDENTGKVKIWIVRKKIK